MSDKTKLETYKILVLLGEERGIALAEAARTEGVSMGEIIRDALDAYLKRTYPVSIAVSAVTDDGADMPTE